MNKPTKTATRVWRVPAVILAAMPAVAILPATAAVLAAGSLADVPATETYTAVMHWMGVVLGVGSGACASWVFWCREGEPDREADAEATRLRWETRLTELRVEELRLVDKKSTG